MDARDKRKLLVLPLTLVLLSLLVFAGLRQQPWSDHKPIIDCFSTCGPLPEESPGPWVEAYFQWIGGHLHGDFGTSRITGQPIGDALRGHGSITARELAIVFAVVTAVALVSVAATARRARRPLRSPNACRLVAVRGLAILLVPFVGLVVLPPLRLWQFVSPSSVGLVIALSILPLVLMWVDTIVCRQPSEARTFWLSTRALVRSLPRVVLPGLAVLSVAVVFCEALYSSNGLGRKAWESWLRLDRFTFSEILLVVSASALILDAALPILKTKALHRSLAHHLRSRTTWRSSAAAHRFA